MRYIKSLALPTLVVFFLFGCKSNQANIKDAPQTNEITYNSYENDWQLVTKLEQQGMGKAVLAKVNGILEKATVENNISQIFKALAYQSKYTNQLEEEATLNIIKSFEERTANADFPLKQLLHSATAELYHQYYNQNRWRFNQRTKTEAFESEDLRSWSLEQILEKVNQHYLASLENKNDLLKFPISNLQPILNNTEESNEFKFTGAHLRPSLYDFLADRAIGYFKMNEARISRPIDEFNLKDYAVFSPVEEFISIDFNTEDTSSNDYLTASLFQELLMLHQDDKNPAVLVDFDLERLRHYYSSSTNEIKDSLYSKALQRLSKKYFDYEVVDEIDYELARLYFEWGNKYASNAETEDYRWYIAKSAKICSTKVDKSTYGALQCQALLTSINSSSFSFQTENTYLPSKPILYRIQHKNIDSLFFKLVSIPFDTDQRANQRNQEEYLRGLVSKKSIRNWAVSIKDENDFQQHSFEHFIEGLKGGNYAMLSSDKKDFKAGSSAIGFSTFSISQLAYFSRRKTAEGIVEVYVLDRQEGTPIPNASVHAFSNDYNYQNRNNQLKKIGSYLTNNKGFLAISTESKTENIQFYISKGADTLSSNSSYYVYKLSPNLKPRITSKLFTDRAIYRPGQTVYFKGIVLESDENSQGLKSNYKSKVTLYNVNGEKLSDLSLTTNDYGSYQGNFVLPASGLNGIYRIQDQHGSYYFNVEEYKRPTFKIELDENNNQRKLNSTIQVTGKVVAFAGNTNPNTKLTYRVVRRATYPVWSYYRSFIPPANEKEIANGISETNEKGEFNFNFLAQADQSLNKNWDPVYNFEIITDATLASGETQSSTTTIQLSSKALFLSVSIDEAVELEELKKVSIEAKNINGANVKTEAQLTLWKLKEPKTPTKSKLWSTVDQSVISEKEYNKLFPDYPTANENDLSTFEKDYSVTKVNIKCNEALSFIKDLKPGVYELDVISKDSFGAPVTMKKRFVLYDSKAKKPPYPVFSWFKALNTTAEPGGNAEFLMASSLKNLRLLVEIEVDNKIVSKEWVILSNTQRLISIPIVESYRGNISVYFSGVHSDRFIQFSQVVKVPFTNKELTLELGTFRSKIEPKSKEKWSLTIKGSKGEAVSAELLAGMYDKSLDQFVSKDWNLSIYNDNNNQLKWDINESFNSTSSRFINKRRLNSTATPQRQYPTLNWFGFALGYNNYSRGDSRAMPMLMQADGMVMNEEVVEESTANKSATSEKVERKEKRKTTSINPIRSDFRETAFFYPQLKTDKDGVISFNFTMPDALTQWKFRALAHTKDLKVGSLEESIITQKELMVVPNVPRFFREGDEFLFTALISNLSTNQVSGTVSLEFFDPISNNKIDVFVENSASQSFTAYGENNTSAEWKIKIPNDLKAISYRIIAKTATHSDGEEKAIPVLANRMLVTESLPLWVRGNQRKQFSFDKLLNSTSSKSLNHESFTIEFTSNPAWYAIQALPEMVANENDCSEKVFTKLFANAIAEKIATSQPKIRAVFDQWRALDSKELSSKLMQNKELKSILIEETPWLKAAISESEQKKRIALLFDFNRMASEKQSAIEKLAELQSSNGGWSWYNNMPDNRYISQYIIEGLGRLNKLGVELGKDPQLNQAIIKGINYLDQRITEDYENILKNQTDLEDHQAGKIQIQYLYARSLFPEISLPKNRKAFDFYLNQAKKFWLKNNIYQQAMIGFAVKEFNPENDIPLKIKNSLKDNALLSDELGMYWKNNSGGYYWYQAPIETQALLIEFFSSFEDEHASVEEMKIWLLKQKQTQTWSNSKATAAACYALLNYGDDLLETQSEVVINVGKTTIDLQSQQLEAGTGYFKKVWKTPEVNSSLGNIIIEKNNKGIGWGSAYWQYHQDLDEITSAQTEGLKLKKSLFKSVIDDKGERMIPIDASAISVGDKVKVRLRIEVDRNMEFVHLKDMRASALEPIDVISKFKYQDGLGYYQSTKDASTNFFMDWLPKGVYVFEYDLRASQVGEFSNGISSIQCQYAPEFSAHSKGKRIEIAN